MENLVKFWKDKKVFLTGHTGFKGSWLSLWLQRLQAQVVGYSLAPPTPTNLFTEAKVAENIVDLRGDIRDFDKLKRSIDEHKPDIIIHLAAQPLVKYSYSHPVETYATNIMGTVHLLEAARHASNLRVIINVTTDKCYENKGHDWSYQESEPMGGYDPYSSSKGCSELITNAYRNSYELNVASARAGNVIGGGDWAQDRLLPDLILACRLGQAPQIRYPQAVRPWQHVLESLSGYLRLAELLYHEPKKYAQAWNFGPDDNDAKSVAWVTTEVLKQWNPKLSWQPSTHTHEHEAINLKLDCAKARSQLGWIPKWSIDQALSATVSWYKQYYDGVDARKITLEQIDNYES